MGLEEVQPAQETPVAEEVTETKSKTAITSTENREEEMGDLSQISSDESLDYDRAAGGLDPQRNALLPQPTSCPDLFAENFAAQRFRQDFSCEVTVEECGISDTIDGCRPPGRKENKAHVSRGMRKTCFTRPSHLIVGIRKPKDAPIAVTPGVRLGALMNRTERMDKNLFATLERVMDDTNAMLELGNDPYLIENTNQIKKDYEDLVGICEALRTAHLDISSRNMVLEWIQRLQLTDDQLEESRKQLQRQADDLVQIHKEKAAEVGRMLSVAQSTMKNIDEAIDTIQFVKMSDDERRRRVILEENQIHMEFMNLVANTIGAMPEIIDWMLLQFCSKGSLFARILKFTPLYLACSNSSDEMHAGLINSSGLTNPKHVAHELSLAKKLMIGALAQTRDLAQKALDEYVENYLGPTEAALANDLGIFKQ